MHRLQSVDDLSEDEIGKLFNSIDYVFFDIDGVLLHDRSPIPGSVDYVDKIRKSGKKVAFASNNTLYPISVIVKNIEPFGGTVDEVISPNSALLTYLKKIDFKKDIYIIGCNYQKNFIREAGYNVIEYKNIITEEPEESLSGVRELSFKVLDVCKNVGIVLVDLDFRLTYGAVQAAKIILNHIKDVQFLTGITDDSGPIHDGMMLIGSKFYIDGLARWTNREPVALAKPSLAFKEVLNSRFNISDDSRVLFIGDNLYTDIAFGVNCGYKTCLVMTGATKKREIEDPNLPESIQPTYIVQSLGHFYEKIKHL